MEIERIRLYDIETVKGYFLFSVLDPVTQEWKDFSINQYQNDLYEFIKYLEDNQDKMFVGYNNINFDGIVVEDIWRQYSKWYNKTNLEISSMIWESAQDAIERQNYELFPKYREEQMTFQQLDLIKIQHFDNKNRRVGLKRLEFEMDLDDVREMSIPHTKIEFTKEECNDLVYYCHNDIKATYLNYLHVIGEVEHELYKGKNQVEVREALGEKFGFNCLNFSNSKYGDEIIKTIYCREAGIDYENLPKKGTFRKVRHFKYGIPSFIKFETPELQKFFNSIKTKILTGEETFAESVMFRGQQYDFGVGGIHNKIENKRYEADEEYDIIDADVTGYYARTIINNGYYPAHLKGEYFKKAYRWVVDERETLKPQAKKDKKIKGIADGYKEAGNACYGKSGDVTSWLYDPQMMLNICLSGQLSIMMYIEQQELSGNHCIMANTDGASFKVKKGNREKFYQVGKKWMKMTNYNLEYFDFLKMYFLSVNDYIAVKTDGEIKRKGEFLTDTELHKNKSFRIIKLALSAYFIDNIDIEEFINTFEDLKQFCGRSVAGQSYVGHIGIDKEGKTSEQPKLSRFYVAKDGIKLIKIAKKDTGKKTRDAAIAPSEKLKTICNYLPKEEYSNHKNNIDRKWYIEKTKEIAYRIDKGRKLKVSKKIYRNEAQISLF